MLSEQDSNIFSPLSEDRVFACVWTTPEFGVSDPPSMLECDHMKELTTYVGL
jgi:hypothetical protein